MVDDGEVTLDDTIVLRREGKVSGSGVLQKIHDGVVLTLSDLLYLTTSVSDNPSNNLLIDLVVLERVNWTLRKLGLAQSTLVRKMEGRPARGMDNENLATSVEFARFMEMIVSQKAASAELCDQMIRLLDKQQNGRRIARYVSKQESIRRAALVATEIIELIETLCGPVQGVPWRFR